MQKYVNEFGIRIYWSKDNAPGFYIRAGWANSGQAEYPIDDQPVSPGTLARLLRFLDDEYNMDGSFADNEKNMLGQWHDIRETNAYALRLKIAEAEAALRLMGMEP